MKKAPDADWFGGYHLVRHIYAHIEQMETSRVISQETFDRWIALSVAVIYIFHIGNSYRENDLYYGEKTHPHPVIRLYCTLIGLFSVLKGSATHKINVKEISRQAILITGILLREERGNPVQRFQTLIEENVAEIREYLKKLILDVADYPYAASKYLPVYPGDLLEQTWGTL